MAPSPEETLPADQGLMDVLTYLKNIPDFQARAGESICKAFEEIIDTERTDRWGLDSLEKTEKTYIGTKVEILFRNEFKFSRGRSLDNLICEKEVDTKFSLTRAWMIPAEAVGQLCLLVSGNDQRKSFDVGLVRADLDILNPGSNRDGKRTLSSIGRTAIQWIVLNAPLPMTLLSELDVGIRDQIRNQTSAAKRIQTLFELVQNRAISRFTISTICRTQDPLKRAREAKPYLLKKGILVLCSTYLGERQEIINRGFSNIADDEWISVDVNH